MIVPGGVAAEWRINSTEMLENIELLPPIIAKICRYLYIAIALSSSCNIPRIYTLRLPLVSKIRENSEILLIIFWDLEILFYSIALYIFTSIYILFSHLPHPSC